MTNTKTSVLCAAEAYHLEKDERGRNNPYFSLFPSGETEEEAEKCAGTGM